jgi:GNAT superfamily N-acetyltransferase
MSSPIAIEEIAIPASVDDPAFADYSRFIDVGNANRKHIFGTTLLDRVPAKVMAFHQDQTYFQQRLYAARRGGQITGTAIVGHMGQEPSPVAWLAVTVHPNDRRQGIGTALASYVEQRAREAGYTTFQTFAAHTAAAGGPRLASPTGYGDLPANDPGVRFLQRRGYRLEQIARFSFLDLPVDPDVLAERRAAAEMKAGPDYRVVTCVDATPDAWIDDIALLNTRMSTDAPHANMEMDTTPWDAARVRAEEEVLARSGRRTLTAAIEHIPTGKLVAFSQLAIPKVRTRPVDQGATLVLTEHRGHRLGMLVKVANIQALARVSPESPVIHTDNAEENRPMLDVNEAVGFRAIGYGGAWKKTLGETP